MANEEQIDHLHIENERERTHRKIFSKVSHDLRTPLSLITGSLEIYERMKDQLPQEKKDSLIALATQEAYKLDNFITNILDMESLENDTISPKNQPFNLASLIEECILHFNVRIKDNKITITKDTKNIEVNSDSSLLSKVIKLCIDNAIKYASNGASILIECTSENNNAIIKIHDNGPGIPAIQHENIFIKYKKLTTNSSSNASTGLGLTISRKIMALLKGTITASSSNKYSGAMITITLPL